MVDNAQTETKKGKHEPRCVLLIADDRGVLSLARSALRDAGYLVIPVDEVELALEMLRRVNYDVVVADLQTLKRADGSGPVSKKVSALLHRAREAPVVLGRCGTMPPEDLVNLCDLSALVARVGEALDDRGTNRDPDEGLLYTAASP